METIIQLAVSGLAMGLIYCLVAIEFTLILNTSGLINFGHEKYIMAGAYIFAGAFVMRIGWGNIPSAVVAVILMALIGVFIAVAVFNPLRNLPRLYALTGTMALSMMTHELVRMAFGPRSFTVLGFLSGTFKIGFVTLPRVYIFIIIATAIILYLQILMMTETKVGKAMRSVAQDKEASLLMGINVSFMLVFSAVLSLVICGIVGIFIIPITGVTLGMTTMIGVKGYIAGVVGGLGSLYGAIAGGLVVGLVESLYLALGGAPVFKDAVSFILIILFLLFRPEGLLSEKHHRL